MEVKRSIPAKPMVAADPLQGPRRASSRRRLWDVPDRYMCSLVGTCLSVKEIRKLALRDDLCSPEIGDYDLHGLIVAVCRTRCRTSRVLHKVLERRYRVAVRRFAKAQTQDELLELWADGVDKGDVAGPLWSVLTHPQSSLTVLERAFGDVHMLSHALGATRRIDQQDYDKLGESLEKEREHAAQLRRVVKARDEALEAAEARIAALESRLVQLEARLADERSRVELQEEVVVLGGALETLRQDLRDMCAQRDEAQRQARRLEAERQGFSEELRRSQEQRDAALEEAEAAESHLLDILELGARDRGTAAPRARLQGVRVLYVGGRTSLVPHYRAVVEGQGGSFVHHDGGVEQSCAQLESLVNGAQLVVCPVDAISHSSWLRIKRACKHRTRSFLPVRTSSMASLVSAIRRNTPEGGLRPDARDACN